LNQANLTEIYDKEDVDSASMHLELEMKKRKTRKMFHTSIYTLVSKGCEKFHYMALGVYAKELMFFEDHYHECEDSCNPWYDSLRNSTLPSQDHPYWSRERKKTLEDYEAERGLKSNPELDKIMSEIASEEHQKQQTQRA